MTLTEEQERWTQHLMRVRANRITQAREALDRLEESGKGATVEFNLARRDFTSVGDQIDVTVEVPEGPAPESVRT